MQEFLEKKPIRLIRYLAIGYASLVIFGAIIVIASPHGEIMSSDTPLLIFPLLILIGEGAYRWRKRTDAYSPSERSSTATD